MKRFIFHFIKSKTYNTTLLILLSLTASTSFAVDIPHSEWTYTPFNDLVASTNHSDGSTFQNKDSQKNPINSDYIIIADTIDISDNSMILGDVFGTRFQLGADSKIYGNVDAPNGCTLRAKSHITGNLRYGDPCNSETGATAASTK